jgi:hypothetical protein
MVNERARRRAASVINSVVASVVVVGRPLRFECLRSMVLLLLWRLLLWLAAGTETVLYVVKNMKQEYTNIPT